MAETITLGCRLNFAESEAMRSLAGEDTIIVNSCAVTAEAERQTRQAIRRARRERPEARIVVTGCAAQLSPDALPVSRRPAEAGRPAVAPQAPAPPQPPAVKLTPELIESIRDSEPLVKALMDELGAQIIKVE